MIFFRVTEFAYLFLSSVDVNNNIQFSGSFFLKTCGEPVNSSQM